VIIAVVIAVYVVGFVVTYRKGYVITNDEFARMGPVDRSDRAMAAGVAMMLGVMWPVMWVGYGIYRTLTPVTPRERKADLDAREREIVRLERELGIKHDD
jgi:hypothetical protein